MTDRPGLARLIRESLDPEKAVQELARLAFESDDPQIRLEAIRILLSRGWGEPPQFAAVTSK